MSSYCVPVGPRIGFHSERETRGGFANTVMQELGVEDEAEFHAAFPMDISTFNELLNMVSPFIEHEGSRFQSSIPARDWLYC